MFSMYPAHDFIPLFGYVQSVKIVSLPWLFSLGDRGQAVCLLRHRQNAPEVPKIPLSFRLYWYLESVQDVLRKGELTSLRSDRLVEGGFDVVCESVDGDKRQGEVYSSIIIRLNQTRLSAVSAKCELRIDGSGQR